VTRRSVIFLAMDLDTIPWTLVRRDHEGLPLLVRFRQFGEELPRTRLPERLNIMWQMREPDVNGLTTAAEYEQLEAFEAALVAAVERDGHAVLSAVLTTGGQREFVFHTADPAVFLERLTEMPQQAQRYPIEIHRNHDPRWAYFDAVTSVDG
jgi:hypothetical protein